MNHNTDNPNTDADRFTKLGESSGRSHTLNALERRAMKAVALAPEMTPAQVAKLRLILGGTLNKLDQMSAMADTNVGGTSHVA